MRIAGFWSLSTDSSPLEKVLLLALQLQRALVEIVEGTGSRSFSVSSTKYVQFVAYQGRGMPVSFLR